ncbi:MAG: hypothetical protein GY793_01490 [Proteobacteria bacterium]|nr:hypothetical protein [Pseudomonadota bacterium]
MENIFTLDVFLISLPIYIACIVGGYMLAIKPKRDKSKAMSFSQELYSSEEDEQDLKLESEEDFDLYLDLSDMFRKSGEFDKAVRVHQKMLEKENISNLLRGKILLELGMDFAASGMFNQAEEKLLACVSLLEKGSAEEYLSSSELSKLYERQEKWEKAVVFRRKLAQNNEGHKSGLALLLCNIAKQECVKKNVGNAKQHYQDALEIDKDCVVAVEQLIKLALKNKQIDEAYNLLENYVNSSVRLVNLLVFAFDELLQKKSTSEKTLGLLQKLIQSENCAYELGILYCKQLNKLEETVILQGYISDYNENYKNNLQAIHAMASFLKDAQIKYNSKDHKNVLLEKIENMLDKEYNYQCGICGYHTKQPCWHCPQCQKWNTLERIYR